LLAKLASASGGPPQKDVNKKKLGGIIAKLCIKKIVKIKFPRQGKTKSKRERPKKAAEIDVKNIKRPLIDFASKLKMGPQKRSDSELAIPK
jgi:hypothetical protein